MSSRDTYPNHTYNFSLHLSFNSILRHSVISKCLLYVPVTSIPVLTDYNVEIEFMGLSDHHVSYVATGNYQQYRINKHLASTSFGFYKVDMLGYDKLYKKINNRLGAGFIPW